jgi:sodium/potassium/calcium exchanger 6
MYHCSSPGQQPLVLVGLILYLLYAIMLLASTADNWFVVELQTLSSVLKLSDDVAGVTLLALGNGAPDVFTAVVGLGQDDFQVSCPPVASVLPWLLTQPSCCSWRCLT